jgi:carbonic anhydrase
MRGFVHQALFLATLAVLALSTFAGPVLHQPDTQANEIPQIKPSEYAKLMERPVTSELALPVDQAKAATTSKLAGFRRRRGAKAWDYKNTNVWATDFSSKQKVSKKDLKPGMTMSPTTGMCDGEQQSPIDIIPSAAVHGVKNKLSLNWFNATGFAWEKTGTGIKGRIKLAGKGFAGSTTTHLGTTYQLEDARFVSPGEHAIDGKQPPLEVQFVHKAGRHPDGTVGPMILVVRFDFSDDNKMPVDSNQEDVKLHGKSKGNPVLAKDLDWLKSMKALKSASSVPVPGRCCQMCPKNKPSKPEVIGCKYFQPLQLVPPPSRQDYFWYRGSQTTPPCTENVLWIIFKEHMYMTYAQWKAFDFKGNFRPIQNNKNEVHFLDGHPGRKSSGALNPHAFIADCGLWGINCAKNEFYAT